MATYAQGASLVLQDCGGHSGVIHSGLAQRMSAGSGILNSEKGDTHQGLGHGPTPRRDQGVGVLAQGDAACFTATGGQDVAAVEPAEILIWEMQPTATV
ncbi:hypothetical protein AB0H86_26090 [Streptomyces sp. NPDC050997]|uniref:hypothetical protein n=1 Tax=Streptomyces sp. NPDC050997 TaxID=3155519 RepID=UPI0034494ECC